VSEGGAIPVPGSEGGVIPAPVRSAIILVIEHVSQFAAQAFHPLNIFRFSLGVAAVLCLLYAIGLPVRYYEATDKILFSDVSIYYFLSSVAMFMAEKALAKFDRVTRDYR
jgi:hypothetical protein